MPSASARGAVALLPSMPAWAFAAMVAGGMWLCLWTRRMCGCSGWFRSLIGALGAALAPSPDLLITGDGRHLAVVARRHAADLARPGRRLCPKPAGRSIGFRRRSRHRWRIEPPSDCSRDACVALLRQGRAEWRLLATRSATRIDWADDHRACAASDIVVSDRRLPRGCSPRWLKLDRDALRADRRAGDLPRPAATGRQRRRSRRSASLARQTS